MIAAGVFGGVGAGCWCAAGAGGAGGVCLLHPILLSLRVMS